MIGNEEYQDALQEIEGLMMAKLNSVEAERLDLLVTLVEDYEHKHFRCSSRISFSR